MRDYTIPGIQVRDHELRVPLDWSNPDGHESIPLFVRELASVSRRTEDLPLLLYLQGGPGGKAPRPMRADGWIGEALKTYRVILLDQRGTGRSAPIDRARIRSFGNASRAAGHLAMFRADSIVADAEHVRATLYGGRRWTTLGQSYGGFLTLTYLSRAPEALSACLVTGGLASLEPDATEVYRRTFPRADAKNRQFYARYPHAVDLVGRIADRVAADPVRLPDGDVLTVRRLQSLGLDFGMKPGFERLHWMLDEALDPATGDLTDVFLAQVWGRTAYLDDPLFAVLQENIYCTTGAHAIPWAAQAERDNHPQFAEAARPLLFTGEMIFPWMFEEIAGLRPFAGAVDELVRRSDWSVLYDRDRLARNEVPVCAAIYFDDMYVDAGLQLDTARRVGNMHHWVTNEYEHDGLNDVRVFQRLKEIADGLVSPDGR